MDSGTKLYVYKEFDQTAGPAFGHNELPDNGVDLKALFFEIYFANRPWDLIVTRTNEIAAENVRRENHKENWNPVSRDEMKAFIPLSMYI